MRRKSIFIGTDGGTARRVSRTPYMATSRNHNHVYIIVYRAKLSGCFKRPLTTLSRKVRN